MERKSFIKLSRIAKFSTTRVWRSWPASPALSLQQWSCRCISTPLSHETPPGPSPPREAAGQCSGVSELPDFGPCPGAWSLSGGLREVGGSAEHGAAVVGHHWTFKKRDPDLLGKKSTLKWNGSLLPYVAGRDEGSWNQMKQHICPRKLSFASQRWKQAEITFAFHFLLHNSSTVKFWRQWCESSI